MHLKLAISNIIWTKGRDALPGFLDAAMRFGVCGVELALNAIFEEPTFLSDTDLIALQEEIASRGLVVSALHSLTFTRADLELFNGNGKREALIEYLIEYARIARLLRCNNLVFGSPSARKMHGRTRNECDDIFLSFLAALDDRMGDVFFNIEPLHPAMCEYLHTLQDARKLIMGSNLHNIKIQLDLRSCIENNENVDQILTSLPFITHCQVSDPGLTMLTATHSQKHADFATLLREANYTGFITGEMLPPNGLVDDYAMQAAVNSLKTYYG